MASLGSITIGDAASQAAMGHVRVDRVDCVNVDPPQAEEVMKRLFGIGPDIPPKVFRVKFRDADGSIGRRDFATHWIHWYPAKMFHRIPQAILSTLSPRSPLTILDPFCGSGTVLLEGALRGHRVHGIDVNPVARLISRVKTVAIDPRHIQRHVAGILRRALGTSALPPPDPTLDFWFKRNIRRTLHNLFQSISYIDHLECREFFQIAFSSIIRSCSLADPRIPPPVKLKAERARTANQKYRGDLERALKLRSNDVHILFTQAVEENLNRMEQLHEVEGLGQATVLPAEFEAARTGLADTSIDLVVTSPPYCGAQKYARSLRLEMLMMNVSPTDVADADRRTLGTERITTTDILAAPITRFGTCQDF